MKYSETEIQRRYYSETADKYDEMHVNERDGHYFALCLMLGLVDFLDVKSILEVGSGTGRAIIYAQKQRPDLIFKGVEPVQELRTLAYSKGVSPEDLSEGDGLQLQFDNNQFDLVCSFGVLHHVKTPNIFIKEMLRVARKAIFISDSNNFGQGSFLARTVKQTINMMGLWPIANLIKTKGRGYTISEGDGLAYSYSVFNNYQQIQKSCKSVHLFNTSSGGINLYRTADHIAFLGIKD